MDGAERWSLAAPPAQEGRAPEIPRWEWGWHRPQSLRVVLSGSPRVALSGSPLACAGQRRDEAAPEPSAPAQQLGRSRVPGWGAAAAPAPRSRPLRGAKECVCLCV